MSLVFDDNHQLIKGRIHSCEADEFIWAFCAGGERENYQNAVVNIFDYAKDKGARRIFVGGSFVTSKEKPNDFDCVIVFNSEGDIPDFVDSTIIDDIEFDILFASESNPVIIDSFIDLFSTYKNGETGKPIVEVILSETLHPWKVRFVPDEDQKEVIKKVYTGSNVIERRKSRGILFSIHGVNTKAYWNSKLAPLASSQGWIFAPFIYDSPKRLLFFPKKRRRVVEQFAEYYEEMTRRYEATSASVIAHSFGTYIIAKYLHDRSNIDFLRPQIDSIILTGAIVNNDYNWSYHYPAKVGRILNIWSPNDGAVKWMPRFRWIKKVVMWEKDGIFGKIGYEGCNPRNSPDGFFTNLEANMLNHTNTFSDEVLIGHIMPFLNANEGVTGRQFIRHISSLASNGQLDQELLIEELKNIANAD